MSYTIITQDNVLDILNKNNEIYIRVEENVMHSYEMTTHFKKFENLENVAKHLNETMKKYISCTFFEGYAITFRDVYKNETFYFTKGIIDKIKYSINKDKKYEFYINEI